MSDRGKKNTESQFKIKTGSSWWLNLEDKAQKRIKGDPMSSQAVEMIKALTWLK